MKNYRLTPVVLHLGGQNRGPWVRAYMDGNEGNIWPWWAGFVTFVLKQAAELMNQKTPIKGSFSCDVLAAQGKAAKLFHAEKTSSAQNFDSTHIFLVRRTKTDWTHTGFAIGSKNDGFLTIEGNTNDDGHRKGYEVCKRFRSFKNMDFIEI